LIQISDLLAAARSLWREQQLPNATLQAGASPVQVDPVPDVVLFFSVSNGSSQAQIEVAAGDSFDEAWRLGSRKVDQWVGTQKNYSPKWLRVDLVDEVRVYTWLSFKETLSETKRNYLGKGFSLKADFSQAYLSDEIGARALLYDNDHPGCVPHEENYRIYTKKKFGEALSWPSNPDDPVWVFSTRAVFCDGAETHIIEHKGRFKGYRKIAPWDKDFVMGVIRKSEEFLASQCKPTGEYIYGWYPCFDRVTPSYNAVRHAGATYSLMEAWEVTQNPSTRPVFERAIGYLTTQLVQKIKPESGSEIAFLVDVGNEIKLGGNGVSLVALCKYTELTQDRQYLELMHQLADGLLMMQKPSGGFVHVLNYPDLSLKDEHRTIYYDGEAAFGLMRLYVLTGREDLLSAVERAFDYFIAADHWKAHDHWLSYATNELTAIKPHEKYFRFGLKNVSGHLDFVDKRITTYPTLLELMMAAEKIVTRIQSDARYHPYLSELDLARFYEALESRARYLMNGFFWPEVAMYFRKPARILYGFFIRHHRYRCRIDDVAHYLSGYVAYWNYKSLTGGER
jgi:hypothetical protein